MDVIGKERFPWLAGTAIVILGLGLRFVFWTGPIGSDDSAYYYFAEKFAALTPFTEVHHSVRLAFLALVAVPAAFAGQMTVGILVNVAFSAANDLLVLWLGYRLYGPRPGLLAVLVASLCGVNLIFPSTLLPDTLLTTFFLLATLSLERGSRRGHERLLWVALAGAFSGIAYSTKDAGILLLPPALAFLFLTRGGRERFWILGSALYLAGFAAVVVLENSVYYLFTGHFFYRQIAIAQAHNTTIAASTPLHYLQETLQVTTTMATRHAAYGTGVILAAVPVWIAMLRRRDAALLIALIGGFTLIYLLAGTSSLTKLVHLPYQPRYLQPVIPFAALAVAAASAHLTMVGRQGLGLWVGSAVAALTILPSLLAAPLLAGNLFNEPYYRNAAAAIEVLSASETPVFMHSNEIESLRHFVPGDVLARIRALPRGRWSDGYYVISPARRPWRDMLAEQGASVAFRVREDRRTYRNICPTCRLPDFSREDRREALVLEVQR